MLDELLNAVYVTLCGSTYFRHALAIDPNAPSEPAIYLAHSSLLPPAYDCLTYALSSSTVDRRFEPVLAGASSAPVESARVDFAYWTSAESLAPILAGFSELDRLLRFAPGYQLANGSGRVFKAVPLTRQPNMFDKDLHKLYGLVSYQFMVQAVSN